MIQVLDFYADWCQPCKQMKPMLDALEQEFSDVEFKKIDIDKEDELRAEYDVMSVPTLIIKRDGEMTARFIGVVSKQAISEAIS